MADGAQLEIRVLGRFLVRRSGEEVPPAAFGGRLVRTLVRLLVTRRGEVVTRDALAAALWPDRPPADPDANLNVLVNRARRALGQPGPIETATGGYLLSRDPSCVIDAESFVEHVERGLEQLSRGDGAAALGRLEAALRSWGGDPLPEDAYADWARSYRDWLLGLRQRAVAGASEASLLVGDPRRALTFADQAVAAAPLHEAAHLVRMRALAASGDAAAALSAYRELEATLAAELGVDPSPPAVELHAAILRGEAVAPTGRGRSAAVGTSPAPGARLAAQSLPFLGREHELTAALDALHDGAVVAVVGRSGAGKSRFLAELTARTGRQALALRAFAAEREEPWSVARALLSEAVDRDLDAVAALPQRAARAVANVVLEVADLVPRSPEVLDPETRRALLLEAGVALVDAAVGDGALVVVDDLQWTDASSLQLLARLAARLEHVTMLLAYRPEEVASGSYVASFLADLRASSPLADIRLPPLSRAALAEAVVDRGLVDVLVSDTDGSPFAITEVLTTLTRAGALRREPDGRARLASADGLALARRTAAAGQRRSVAARSARQPVGRRQLLALLALLARETPARLLAAATGREEGRVLDDLETLAQAGLVRIGEQGWATGHDLIAETAAGELDPGERGRLHQLLATALSAGGGDAAERAHHLAAAGDASRAAGAYAAAARARLDRFADQEARRLASAGLELTTGRVGAPDAPVEGDTCAELLEVRAETHARGGQLQDAQRDLQAASRALGPVPDRARLLARRAMLASGADDLVHASELVELALVESGDDPAARAAALAVAAVVDMNLERYERATARRDEALRLFESLGDARGVAGVVDGRAMATLLRGDLVGSIGEFGHACRLLAGVGDLVRVVTPRSTLGHTLVFADRASEGLGECGAALDLARSLGYREGEAYALWHRSEALAGLGRGADARASAEAALVIARDIGHRGWTATALRALGIAHEIEGDLAAAERSFAASLEASEHLSLFSSWAASRLGGVLLRRGRLVEAEPLVERALSEGPALAHYEARLVAAEVAVAKGVATVAGLHDLARRARAGGHLVSAIRLERLATRLA